MRTVPYVFSIIAVLVLAGLPAQASATPAAATGTGPSAGVLASSIEPDAVEIGDPDTPPPGANDWSCEPDEQRPNPVVLAHGLLANQAANWRMLAPLLADEGYCVFSLTYGVKDGVGTPVYTPGGMTRMEDSAEEFGAFVDRVLAETGAQQVDLVGHSQGTLMPSYYVRFLDGAANIDNYISLTPLWQGTTLLGLDTLYAYGEVLGLRPVVDLALETVCESCSQFLRGSDFLKRLHAVGIFDPDVTYTNVVTRYDEVVVPYTSGIAEGENITNIVLQDECSRDFGMHVAPAFSTHAAGHVLNALDPAAAEPVPCRFVGPAGNRWW
ncbi:alpha/beta fold hydrolase [Haloechinothrix sp. LS1_15]|uniref:esterase/lipase family protein n=1 Tax=Haloechinothrix sp. LS1_15 TaxID=2652248 RepID=UPI002946A9F4|nr:alpha/beta fold hydrolase [Haloechinothrix sp. LS1_15]MDV6011334.1 alpha/beta fold hydrolase [Haloechinothrix sp. LS1_15]